MDKRVLALELLPSSWRREAEAEGFAQAEEIRLRLGRPPSLLTDAGEKAFRSQTVQQEELRRILEKATGASLHTVVSSLADGFVNYRGLRVGVCGSAVSREGKTCAFLSLSSLAVRIPRECRGAVDREAAELLRLGFANTLVLGPPGAGKTTALRELIRVLADSGLRVGVADERGELSAQDAEGPCFDLGRCSDVICGVPKAEAAMMLLRGMNPQILAMDEITAGKDADALRHLAGCGVALLASVHGRDRSDLCRRPDLGPMLDQGLFAYILKIRRDEQGRHYCLEPWAA